MPQGKNTDRALAPAELEHVRQRLEQLIEELGSQSAVNRATGIPQQTISKIFKGGTVGMKLARRLAEYDQVPVEVLIQTGYVDELESLLRDNPDRWSVMTISSLRAFAKEMAVRAAEKDPYSTVRKSRKWWAQLANETESALKPIAAAALRRS